MLHAAEIKVIDRLFSRTSDLYLKSLFERMGISREIESKVKSPKPHRLSKRRGCNRHDETSHYGETTGGDSCQVTSRSDYQTNQGRSSTAERPPQAAAPKARLAAHKMRYFSAAAEIACREPPFDRSFT